jgi:hypothetical protein
MFQALGLRKLHPEGDGGEGAAPTAPTVPAPTPVPAAAPAPSPAASPAPAAAPTEEVVNSDEGGRGLSDFDENPYIEDGDLAIFGEGGPGEGELPPETPPTPAPSLAPVSAPAATPAVSSSPAAPAATPPAAVTPAAPSSPTPPAAPVPPARRQQTIEEVQAANKQWRDGLEASARTAYEAVVQEHAAELLTNPEKVLPILAARMYTDTVESVFRAVMQGMPQVVQDVSHQNQQTRALEQYVVSKVPELAVAGNVVETNRRMKAFQSSAHAIRQLNPEMTADDLIIRAGAATKLALGLLPGDPAPAPAVSPGTVTAASPSTPPAPFRPGRPGGGALPAPAPSGNVFGELTDEWDKEDGRTK